MIATIEETEAMGLECPYSRNQAPSVKCIAKACLGWAVDVKDAGKGYCARLHKFITARVSADSEGL